MFPNDTPAVAWRDALFDDSVSLLPANANCPGRDNWAGDSDAVVTARVAGGVEGLYIGLQIWDDNRLETRTYSPFADELCLYFDTLDSKSLYECTGCRVGLLSTVFSSTSKVLCIPLSGKLDSTALMLSYSDENYAGAWRTLLLSSADSSAECVGAWHNAHGRDSASVFLEILVRWSLFGSRTLSTDPCIAPSREQGLCPAIGTRWAFTVSYFDMDDSDLDTNELAWLGGDPWSNVANYWGDLVFGASFPAVPTPVESLLTVQPATWQLQRSGGAAHMHPSEAFTLTGRRVEHAHVLSSAREAGVTIVRQGGATKLRVLGGRR